MSLAEELYRISETRNYEYPPLWLDILFAFVLSIIHIYYAFKFTKFSFCFLNAKCEEKQSGVKWSSSKIYLRTILSYGNLQENDDIKLHLYNISLWSQLTLLRNILRILIFVLCWVVLIIYITLSLNILFEYLITCIVNYKKGSFLALIVLPPFLFTNIIIIKYIFYGIMASWSINADLIADEVAEEHELQKAKRFAYQNSIHLSAHEHIDDNIQDLFAIPDIKSLISVSTTHEEQKEEIEQKIEIEQPKTPSEQKQNKTLSFRAKIWTPYFIAVRWRLTVISCAILCTMIALPAMRFEGDDVLITDTFWFQIFLRYMMIAVGLWLFIYVLISMLIALYGRISTVSIYSDIIDKNGNEQTESRKRIKNALRFFCLLDAFSLSDTHIAWKRCKVLSVTVILAAGFLLIIIGWAIQYGLVWFVGVVLIVYYVINTILTSKPRGIHYLWKGNVNALELEHETESEENNGIKKLSTEPSISHAAGMTHLTQRQLNKLLSRHVSTRSKALFEMKELQELHVDINNNNNDIAKQVTFSDDMNNNNNENNNENNDRRGTMQNEQDVIKLFCKLHQRIIDDRKALYTERHELGCGELCRDSLCCCCPGIIRAINWLLIKNYMYSIFREYRGYWLLILPYNYEIRPLSVCPTGNGALLEKVFKFNYKNNSISQTISIAISSTWESIRGFICFIATIAFLFLMLWISLNANKSTNIQKEILTENLNSNISLPSPYPVCDIKWNANLSVLDLTSVSHLSHEIDKREDIISMQDMICIYFDRIFSNNNVSNCQWEVIYISRDEPVFLHIRHKQNKTDIIAIRGTESNLDSLQDFNLFNQVTLLQTASWIVPVTAILPRSFIIQIVYYMSFFEGSIDTQMRQRYDEPVFNYAYNILKKPKYKINSFYIIGHSLGGSVSQAVIGQLHHLYHAGYIINDNNKDLISNQLELKSFSYGSPGLVFNSRKFSLDLNDLYDTATLLKISHDAISNIDVPGGLVQNIECSESQFYKCHKRKNIICELANECGIRISNNPDLIKTMCINKDIGGGYVSYMSQLYNFSHLLETTIAPDSIDTNNDQAIRKYEYEYWYTAIFWIFLYNIIAIIVVQQCRRYEAFQILFCALIIVFGPIYMINDTLSVFGWAKIFSVIASLIVAIRIRYFKETQCIYWTIYILYILNVFGAFLLELSIGIMDGIFNINMISAIILIICTNIPFTSTNTISVNQLIHKTIHYKMSLLYIISYTIWNYTFALNYKCYEQLLVSTIHLFVPLYFFIFNKIKFCKRIFLKDFEVLSSEWFFMRACALLFWLYINSMPFDESIPFWDIVECEQKPVNGAITWIVNVISVLVAIGLLCYQIWSVNKIHMSGKKEENNENTDQSNEKTISFIQFVIASLCCK